MKVNTRFENIITLGDILSDERNLPEFYDERTLMLKKHTLEEVERISSVHGDIHMKTELDSIHLAFIICCLYNLKEKSPHLKDDAESLIYNFMSSEIEFIEDPKIKRPKDNNVAIVSARLNFIEKYMKVASLVPGVVKKSNYYIGINSLYNTDKEKSTVIFDFNSLLELIMELQVDDLKYNKLYQKRLLEFLESVSSIEFIYSDI